MVVLGLLVLGAAWDLLHLRAALAPPPGPEPAAAAPMAEAAPATGVPAAAPAVPAAPLDLNRATSEDLDRLPGIGPVLAARIVEYRTQAGAFRSVDELMAVRGIGPRLFERLRPLVSVQVAAPRGRERPVQNAMPSRK